jgi:SAM-dependent methyltransferase
MDDGDHEPTIPFALWKQGGITEHLGGAAATLALADGCGLASGARVLEVGCGTGYTATMLAQRWGVSVAALDVMAEAVRRTGERAAAAGVRAQVWPVQGDAARLPFADSAFDCILAESVLVFCPAATAAAEFWRGLRPGGCVGANEFTLLGPTAPALERLLRRLGIRARDEAGWRQLFVEAGFSEVRATVRPISLGTQLRNHLRVDGLRGYLASARRALAEPAIRQMFANREMLGAYRQFRHEVGYGLYTAIKDPV